jgi:hypothetical protein
MVDKDLVLENRRTNVFGRANDWQRSYVLRLFGENFGYLGESHPE